VSRIGQCRLLPAAPPGEQRGAAASCALRSAPNRAADPFHCRSGLALFVIVHLVMVLASGVWNNLRSMVTGWYDLGNPRMTDVR